MTRFAQIRDLLAQVRGFHGHLADYYARSSDTAKMERVKLLLEYLSSHERNLERSLTEYEEDAARNVLDTWVDESHCTQLLAKCRDMTLPSEMTVATVARLAMQIDGCLARIYRHSAEQAQTESVREVFRNLITLEEGELRKLALNALRAGDV